MTRPPRGGSRDRCRAAADASRCNGAGDATVVSSMVGSCCGGTSSDATHDKYRQQDYSLPRVPRCDDPTGRMTWL
eukprot:1164997-Pyramimonas_sp.AAC.2